MNYRPVGRTITIKILKSDEYLPGSSTILMADVTKARETMAKEEGIILRMGKAVCFDDSEYSDKVEIGDTVAFARYGGKSLGFDDDGNEIRVMKDIDVLAVRED